jgi:hypothetical protein
MTHRAIAALANTVIKGAVISVVTCWVIVPGHASEKLDPDKFEQKLLDTRQNIVKERATTAPLSKPDTVQFVIDICKKNPKLPQCQL